MYGLSLEIFPEEWVEFLSKTDGLVYSAKERPKMIFITKFRVCHSKIFMSCCWYYRSLIKKDNWEKKNSFFPVKYYFLSLFGGIFVKIQFPLKSPFTTFLYQSNELQKMFHQQTICIYFKYHLINRWYLSKITRFENGSSCGTPVSI